jgi:hypothetical protein
LGCALVGVGAAVLFASLAACGDEADVVGEGTDTSAAPVANEDHWHAAFGVYICDHFLPAMPEFQSPVGIHAHGDGVIHIHPFTADAAEGNATLRVFLEGAGIEVSRDELRAGGETYTEGEDTCSGEESEVGVLRWADVGAAHSEPERVDPDVRFRHEGEGYVVAFVPAGAAVPVPESAAELDALGAGDTGTGGPSTTTVSQDAAGDEEASAGASDVRSVVDGFYQVEEVGPAPCRTPGMRADMANENCYLLPDEPALVTEIVEGAEASLSSGPGAGVWQVALTLTGDGIGAFNDVAARCHQRDPTCPLGQIALVVDDAIVFAPTIQEPSYERDQISVSGSFTEDEAQSVADALTR